MTGHQQPVIMVSYSPDGRYIASASFDHHVKLWDGKTGKFVASLFGHLRRVYQVAWSADSRMLVSGSSDSTLKGTKTLLKILLKYLKYMRAWLILLLFVKIVGYFEVGVLIGIL